ncbi:polysaccharide deacetylase family protein [Spelaeicoccus albus]|uniref:Peptidoglycan/xylan/chitin deacetylase (PgdA/CDA1 family) n=1 Tax=Spelaeicoccus albus TaxID=1280376 RepID=A0A7Z0D1F7_9MICO|nr:polysaccharide deacetylase family protein [Spelaeicoccus albus]NYI66938.1 peptidoglycan/xylan/chitin deacetylase (PgdA/CDA1 family) [Spelaeicoccus albus]
MTTDRDLVGYGGNPPTAEWPDGKKLALSIVVNYEEGSERSHWYGDDAQESDTEWGKSPVPSTVRDLAMESMYEYGSRVGIWRILRVLDELGVRATLFTCAEALRLNPPLVRKVATSDHEVCSHGLRWEEIFRLDEETERQHMREAIDLFEDLIGARPRGWYCRFGPSVNTRNLVVEDGGFSYDSDSYNDDVPFFVDVDRQEHLVVPYTADVNDLQWWTGNASTSDDFLAYMKDSFNELHSESQTTPRMMSIGLHCRVIGRPGRIGALREFIQYAQQFSDVWITTRSEIADWWHKLHSEGVV